MNIKHIIKNKLWGYEEWIVNKKEYCGKILFFDSDCACSYHYHKIKDETFYVLSGSCSIKYGTTDDIKESQIKQLSEGDSFYVRPGLRHQVITKGIECKILEISTQHFEDDSYRIQQSVRKQS